MLIHRYTKSAHRGSFSAIDAATGSRYPPHPLPEITTQAASAGWTTCKSTWAPPPRCPGLSLRGPKEPRRHPRAERAGRLRLESGLRSRGPRPSEPLTWSTRALSARPSRHPPDFQTCKLGGKGSSFPSYTRRRAGWLTQPPPRREFWTEHGTISQRQWKKSQRQGPQEDLAQTWKWSRRLSPQPAARGGQGRAALAPEPSAAGVRGFGSPPRGQRGRGVGAGAALTVAFVSAARSGRCRPRRRLRGSCRPHSRSCAPRRARRFLAPPSPPSLARGRGEGRRALRELREGSAAAPPRRRAPGPAPGPASGWALPGNPAPRRAVERWRPGSPSEASGEPRAGAGARAGKDAPEDGDRGWGGARRSPSPPPPGSRRRRLAPPSRTKRWGGACARSGAADPPGRARVSAEPSDQASLSWLQLRDRCAEIIGPPLFLNVNVRVVEPSLTGLRPRTSTWHLKCVKWLVYWISETPLGVCFIYPRNQKHVSAPI